MKTCQKCSCELADDATVCSSCGRILSTKPVLPPGEQGTYQASSSDGTANYVTCQQCGNAMARTKRTERNMALQLLGIPLFFLGLWMAVAWFPLGLLPGLILVIVSARLGYDKKPVWMCNNCGYFFERAK